MRLRDARNWWVSRETVALGVVRMKKSQLREKEGTKWSFKGQTSTTRIWGKNLRRIQELGNSGKKKKKEKSVEILLVTGQWVRTTESTLVCLMRISMAVSINILLLKLGITNAPLLAFSTILQWQICKEQMSGASEGPTSAKSFRSYLMKNRAPIW